MKTGTELWTYDTGVDHTNQWIGYEVEATDGRIGKVDEMSTEAGRAHIVVDTGPWIFGKKRMIPAGAVSSVDHEDRTVRVAMTKDQIKDAPDAEDLRDEGCFDRHSTYYGRYA